ncbi:MAG: metallophosphoesterase [Planctomycetota bacterium]
MAHDGPDPVLRYVLNKQSIVDKKLKAELGPDAKITGSLRASQDGEYHSLHFDGKSIVSIADNFRALNQALLPKKEITIVATVSIEKGTTYGGIVGVLQDNGGHEKGWILGYNQKRFYFGLSSTGSDDGDGKMTYLESGSRFDKGKTYHVVAVYDGETMQLMVNGKLEAESNTQSGDILYAEKAPFVIGGYQDENEDFRHIGKIGHIAIYRQAAKVEWAQKDFQHYADLVTLPATGVAATKFDLVVKPYLQWVTQTSITVMWETSVGADGIVTYGETAECKQSVASQDSKHVHEIILNNLKPETQYFYKTISKDASGKTIESDVRTFQTANKTETPFAFAVISDTQGNPTVSGKLAGYAWDQRPNFLLHTGDLVSTGAADDQWTEQFFKSMDPLVSRVAFFPVLGNHEGNARNYYDYMSLPKPEYYYRMTYGNTDFFMIDTNKNVGPDSEQYQWLDKALSKSKATWKIVAHHHPAYSSDENDYGNLWKTNQSTRGDLRVRQLTKLYDQHNVDIVWCGHIHSYERTWHIRKDQVVKEGEGTMYLVTGGGGGGLETPGPFKPAFQNNVRYGHHYCMVAINGTTLEFKAFDLDNRLYDYLKLKK